MLEVYNRYAGKMILIVARGPLSSSFNQKRFECRQLWPMCFFVAFTARGAKRCIDPPAPPPRPPPGPASPRRRVTSKSVRVPEPDAEPPADEETATAAPATPVPKEELLGFGVVGGSDLPDTEEVSACMPLPTGDEATGRVLPGDQPPRATHAGGIGRSAGTKMSKSKVQAGYKKSESMRPDEATGKPGAKLEGSIMSTGTSTGTTVNSATAAADQERLVSAAVAGEVDDVQQLLGRAGVRIDGLVEEGLDGEELRAGKVCHWSCSRSIH